MSSVLYFVFGDVFDGGDKNKTWVIFQGQKEKQKHIPFVFKI
jgi:hypothetical protein